MPLAPSGPYRCLPVPINALVLIEAVVHYMTGIDMIRVQGHIEIFLIYNILTIVYSVTPRFALLRLSLHSRGGLNQMERGFERSFSSGLSW